VFFFGFDNIERGCLFDSYRSSI